MGLGGVTMFRILLNTVLLITELKNLITVHESSVKSLNFETLYPLEDSASTGSGSNTFLYRGNTFVLRKISNTMTHDKAVIHCRDFKSELFSITEDTDLLDIYNTLDITESWVDLKVTNTKQLITAAYSY